jgi:hypothetical protein
MTIDSLGTTPRVDAVLATTVRNLGVSVWSILEEKEGVDAFRENVVGSEK